MPGLQLEAEREHLRHLWRRQGSRPWHASRHRHWRQARGLQTGAAVIQAPQRRTPIVHRGQRREDAVELVAPMQSTPESTGGGNLAASRGTLGTAMRVQAKPAM